MGKRKGGGLTGVSRFLLESLKTEPESQPITPEQPVQGSQHSGADTSPGPEEDRPLKRQKTEGSSTARHPQTQSTKAGWIEKYSASGLVPHHTDGSQVPDYLRKCTYKSSLDLGSYSCKRRRFFTKNSLFFSLLDASRLSAR